MRALGTADQVAQAIQQLPSCYTYAVARCLELNERTAHPSCDLWHRAYDEDYDRMQAAIDSMHFCPVQKIQPWHFYVAAAAAGVFGVGCLVLYPRR